MQTQLTITVKSPSRLDIFLREQLPLDKNISRFGKEISNSKIRRLIFSGNVSVNGNISRNPSYTLRTGSCVTIFLDIEKLFYEKQNNDIDFTLTEKNVIFEDEYILVINKPEHFPTEETIVKDRNNLHAASVEYLHKKNPSLRNPPYAGIIHRLDRDTSGVILFSKQRTVNKVLQEMFDYSKALSGERTCVKVYKALCSYGNKTLKKGQKIIVEDFLGRISSKSSQGKWGKVSEKDGGKYAKSEFTVLSINEEKKLILIQAHIFTGRTHQIRVHLSGIGLPILGDELYGGKPAERIFLHSESLKINHPVTGEEISFYAPPAQGFMI